MSGVRLTITDAPYGVALVDVTLAPLRVVAGSPVSDTSYGRSEQVLDYEVAAYSVFGQQRAGAGQAHVYVPKLDPPPAVVGSATLTLTGSHAAPNAVVQITSAAGTGVASTVADGAGAFAVDVPLAGGMNSFVAQSLYGAGNRSFRSSAVPVRYSQPPDVAVQLVLVAVRGSDVELAFTLSGNPSGVARFDVRRSDGAQTHSVAQLTSDQRGVVDARVPNGRYVYSVAPLNSDGFPGAASNEVTAAVEVLPPSEPAALLVSVPPEGATLDLQWTHVGPLPAGVLVERATGGGGFVTITARPVQGTTYCDRGLTNGIAYTYRVRAVDSAGNAGGYSNLATGTPRDATVPATPVITMPTEAGAPVTVNAPDATIAGRAECGATVELLQNGRYAGTVRADAVAVDPSPYALARPFAQGFDMSRDGQLIAYGYSDTQPHVAIAVEDRSGTAWVDFPLVGLALQDGPRVSPDSTRLVFVAREVSGGNSAIFLGDLRTGAVDPLVQSPASSAQLPAWSPDGQRLAYASYRDGYCLVVTDLTTRTEHVLPVSDGIRKVAWSGARTVLAMLSGWPQSVIEYDLGSGATRTLLEASFDGEWAVASSRRSVALAADVDDSGSKLVLLDLNSGAVRPVPGGEWAGNPSFSPDDSTLAFFDQDNQLMIYDLASGAFYPAGFHATSGSLSWPIAGMLTLVDWRGVQALQVGGRFAVPVELDQGKNVFFATALDASGNRSVPSEPIEVTLDATRSPDLALAVKVLPAIPVVGQRATAVLEISNVGTGDAGPARVSVSIVASDGSIRQLVAPKSPALPAGAISTVLVAVDVGGVAGRQQLIAVVDPGHEIPDGARENNQATLDFVVAQTPALALAVSVMPSTVRVDETAIAHVTLANPGAPQNVVVGVSMTDADGAVVLPAQRMAFAPLESGAVAEFDKDLSVGRILAGRYQVVAEAVSENGVVTRASVPITVESDLAIDLALVSKHGSQFAGEDVTLVSTVTNRSRQAYLQGATYRVELMDATGTVAYAPPAQAVPLLWAGGWWGEETVVPWEAVTAGTYQARATVSMGGTVLAQATAQVVVVGRPLLAGAVSVVGVGKSPPTVPAGANAQLDFTIRNDGTADAQGIVARLLVIDPDTLAVVSSQAVPITGLAAKAEYAGTQLVSTVGLPLKLYAVSLTADHDGQSGDVLATARFRVADAVSPVLEVQNLTSGMFVRGAVAPFVHALDSPSGTAAVRAAVDGQVPVPLQLASGNSLDGLWTGSVPLGTDGLHTIVFTAVDAEGNDGAVLPNATDPVTIAVVSDTIPPRIAITGVTDFALYAAPVAPLVQAEDVNLARVDAWLDGAPYLPGTAIGADGDHTLLARAVDRVGNTAQTQVRFGVDTKPPVVVITGVQDGAFYRAVPVVAQVSATDAHLATLDATLDGVPMSGATAVIADEGPHVIVARATDGAGNSAQQSVTFTIDRTPPVLSISGVTDLSYVAMAVTPTFSATDANFMSVQATLNGAPFTSGTVVATEGDYVLSAWALDRAGNRADHAVAFVVDRTPPAVALSGFIDGSFVATDVIPAFTVTEGHLDHVDAALDGLPFVAGMVATAEGFHTFSVTATDRAGNRTQQAASFTIDKTPPKIAIGGVSDGTSYAAAVSPTYSATDANLDSVTASLDGLPFTSGTAISAEGRHVLTVVALDKAANKATSTVAFTIDTTLPRIILGGFADGSFVNADVLPTYTVDDIDLDSVDAQLDGVRFISGTPVGAEGAHTLVVVANDKAGNSTRQSGTFTIDKTAPVISLLGLTDGSFVNSSIVPVFSATDANLASVAGRLDGMAFASGTTVSSEGAHSLAINASDKAGNTAAKSASFTIDRTPPRIAISGVTDGEMTKVDVHPVVDVSDANLAASAVTLDGQPLVPSTVVSTEGDHVLAAQATDKAGNQASSTVQFTIDKTPPSVVVSGVSDGVHYPAAVTPTIQISDAHLSRTTLTLNGAPFVSGSIVSQDGAYTLMVHAEDTAGNATDKTVAFSIAAAQQYRVTTQVGGRFGRVLALVRAGTCAPAAADLSRLDAFLQSAIVGAGRLLTVTSDESTFLEQVRSGFYDVYVLVGIPLWGKDRGCGGDSCSEQDEAADPKPWDSPPVKTRKAIARELTELTYAGHAGVISIRSRPENLPKYRELLGADLEGYVQETRFTAVGDPFAPMPDLTLGGRAVSLDLLGAIGAGHYASSSRCAGRDVAVATMTLGAGRSVTMGFDPSLATAAVGAAQALGRAVDFVMPADVVAPLAVVGVEVGVNSSANSARTIVRGSVAAPVEIVGAQPQATIDPGGTVAEWSLDLVAGQTSLVWVFPRVPDIKRKSTVTIEVRSSQPGMTAAATQAIDLVNSKTGADLLSDAFAATASLPHGGHDRLLYRQIQQDLIAVQNRIVRSRSDVEKNLSTLLDAVKSSKDLKSPGGASVRLALDELIRYWEARWFVY